MARTNDQARDELASEYANGRSIRELALSRGIAYSAARARLLTAGVSLRSLSEAARVREAAKQNAQHAAEHEAQRKRLGQ